jgi:FkbM family methyltransferase
MGSKSIPRLNLGRLKHLVNRLIRFSGVSVVRAPGPTLDGALDRLRSRNIAISTVIDVGASDGRWSEELMRVYPAAGYLLIEANGVHRPGLDRFCRRHPNAQYAIAAAGAERGMVYFDTSDPFGGVAAASARESHFVSLPSTTIDAEVAERGLHGPFLVKLDTHGFEVPILRGAERTLAEAEVLVIECYNFRVTPEALLFHEMCDFLGQRGFRCIDAFDLMYRPDDAALWQMDLVFVRDTRREFESATYLSS